MIITLNRNKIIIISNQNKIIDSKPIGSNKEKEKQKSMTKTRQKTDSAKDTQYSNGHALKRILVCATVADQLL